MSLKFELVFVSRRLPFPTAADPPPLTIATTVTVTSATTAVPSSTRLGRRGNGARRSNPAATAPAIRSTPKISPSRQRVWDG